MATWRGESAATLTRADPPKVEQGATWERIEPARQSLESSVLVPLAWSCICGVIGAFVGFVGWESFRAGIIGLGVGFSATWVLLFVDLRNALFVIESVTSRDLDKNGVVGKPPEPPGWITIDGQRARRESTKSYAEQKRAAVIRLCEVVYFRQQRRMPAGQKALRGHALCNGWEVTDELHSETGQQLVKAGLAIEKGKGWVLTATPEQCAQSIQAWKGE
jgi:hypothetical protein